MLVKIVLWYLKNLGKKTAFEEECLEMHQKTIKDADRAWKYYRKNKEALRSVIDYINYLN